MTVVVTSRHMDTDTRTDMSNICSDNDPSRQSDDDSDNDAEIN